MVKELNVEPIARMVSFAAVGVEPRIMGIGPVKAVPKALKQANLKLNDIDLIELNEAFASQSLAVLRELNINEEIVNVAVLMAEKVIKREIDKKRHEELIEEVILLAVPALNFQFSCLTK